jgi:hypothetical protein
MHEPRGLIFDRPPFFGVGCTGAARWHRETADHRCCILSFWSIWTLVPHWLVELLICENLQTLMLSLYLTSMQINPPGLWAIHNALVVNLDANMRYNLSPVIPSWTRKPSIINIGNLADQRGPALTGCFAGKKQSKVAAAALLCFSPEGVPNLSPCLNVGRQSHPCRTTHPWLLRR